MKLRHLLPILLFAVTAVAQTLPTLVPYTPPDKTFTVGFPVLPTMSSVTVNPKDGKPEHFTTYSATKDGRFYAVITIDYAQKVKTPLNPFVDALVGKGQMLSIGESTIEDHDSVVVMFTRGEPKMRYIVALFPDGNRLYELFFGAADAIADNVPGEEPGAFVDSFKLRQCLLPEGCK